MSTIEQPLEVGIIIPDFADDLIELWASEEELWCVLCMGKREVARKQFKFIPPLEAKTRFRTSGSVVFHITQHAFQCDNFRIDGLPNWCEPVTYSDIGYTRCYKGDRINFHVRFLFNG